MSGESCASAPSIKRVFQELLNMFDDSRAMNETLGPAADASAECRNISMM